MLSILHIQCHTLKLSKVFLRSNHMPNMKHWNTIFYDTIWHHPVICGEFKTIIGLKIISWHVEPMLSVSVTPQLSAKPKKSFYNLLKLVTGWHLHPDGCLGNWVPVKCTATEWEHIVFDAVSGISILKVFSLNWVKGIFRKIAWSFGEWLHIFRDRENSENTQRAFRGPSEITQRHSWKKWFCLRESYFS